MRRGESTAWPHLRDLRPGDRVPAECYILDYADGTRPTWTVSAVEELASGGRQLVLVDEDQGVALTVLTWPTKTMRTQPYSLGGSPRAMLCDMDQQARHVAGSEVAHA